MLMLFPRCCYRNCIERCFGFCTEHLLAAALIDACVQGLRGFAGLEGRAGLPGPRGELGLPGVIGERGPAGSKVKNPEFYL